MLAIIHHADTASAARFAATISLTSRARHGGEPVERFRLPHLWCFHLYEYEAELLLNGVPHRLNPGSASVIAPDVEMEYRFFRAIPGMFSRMSPFHTPPGARLWDILWRLADRPGALPASDPVARVRELVEMHLAESLYVADLARQVGFSQNHLTRLFRAQMKMTLVEYSGNGGSNARGICCGTRRDR